MAMAKLVTTSPAVTQSNDIFEPIRKLLSALQKNVGAAAKAAIDFLADSFTSVREKIGKLAEHKHSFRMAMRIPRVEVIHGIDGGTFLIRS